MDKLLALTMPLLSISPLCPQHRDLLSHQVSSRRTVKTSEVQTWHPETKVWIGQKNKMEE